MVPETINITSDINEIEKHILEEENIDNLNDIIKLFNISLKKKDLLRSSKLSEAQDKVVNQIISRVTERPDNFSNDDLIKYYKTIQDSLIKTDTSLENINIPTIQLNQQINIAKDSEFDRESRKKILDTVNKILDAAKNNSQELSEVLELNEEDIEIINE